MKRVVLCVSNDHVVDQRLHKVCLTLLKYGFNPILVGIKKRDSLPLSKREYECIRMPIIFNSGKLFYFELNLRLFFYLLFSKADIITANDLDTIFPCYLVSRLKKIRLVYDSHEYFTELPELQKKKFTRAIWLKLEEALFSKLKYISTVGNFIAEAYSKKYNVPVSVIRNMPLKVDNPVCNSKTNIIIYQGAVNVGRGIELMIKAFAYLPEYELWIIGDGLIFKNILEQCKSSNNVKVLGKKTFQELPLLTSQGMLGLSLEEDLGLNYRYSLPNKIFDYVNARIPVIVSDLPEMRALVEKYNIGLVLFNRSPEALSKLIKSICEDDLKYQSFVQSCELASQELNWEMQEPLLVSLYQ
ncbi:MAG: glycosyltransferase [Opitutaceae bacterium]|nr:glycosyltransferase [Cytophagales bacterium]